MPAAGAIIASRCARKSISGEIGKAAEDAVARPPFPGVILGSRCPLSEIAALGLGPMHIGEAVNPPFAVLADRALLFPDRPGWKRGGVNPLLRGYEAG